MEVRLTSERRHRNASYGLSEWPRFPERNRTGTVYSQQRSAHQGENCNDEGEVKMRRYPDGSAGGTWFGYCIVHIRRAALATTMVVDVAPMTTYGWPLVASLLVISLLAAI